MTSRHQLIRWAYFDALANVIDKFVPGDPSLWKVIEESVGNLNFEIFDGILVDWGEDKTAYTTEQWNELLRVPGLTKVEMVDPATAPITIQIRARSRYADDVVSLLQSYFSVMGENAPKFVQKLRIITVTGPKPDKIAALKGSLEKLVLFGAKSGLFDPLFQEARIMGAGDPVAWDYSLPVDERATTFMEYIRVSKRHVLSSKFVIKETGSKFKDGDVVTTVSPLDILSPVRDPQEQNFRRGLDPLTLILGLQARYSGEYSKIVHRELEMLTAFRDRGVSLAYATELYPFSSFLEIHDGFRETYVRNFEAETKNSFLYISRPFDSRNSVEVRKFERFCARLDAMPGVRTHLLGLEFGLCLSIARLAAKESGMMLFDVVLKQLMQWDRQQVGYERCLLMWVPDEIKRDIEKIARHYDISILASGQRQERSVLSIVNEKDELQEIPAADLMAIVQAQSESAVMGTWLYEDDRRPAYGFERANIYPDRFLRRSTQKNKLEMEVGNLLPAYFSGDLSRISLQRGSFSYPLGALRWSDGFATHIEAGGQTHGLSRHNPRSMGLTVVDDAVRWMVTHGTLPDAAIGAIYVSLPGGDIQSLASKQRAALSLAFDGMMSACKEYGIRVRNVRYSAHSGPSQQFELVFRVSKPIDPKKNFTISGFRMEDEVLYAVGPKPPFVDAGSKILPYVRVVSNHVTELVSGNQLALYKNLCHCIDESLLSSMRPVSHGGIAEALGEMALWSGMGAKIKPSVPTIELFSGAPGRFVVGVLPQFVKNFEAIVPSEMYTQLGTSGGKKVLSLPLDELFESRKELANLREEVI
ncbi:MAG TPA: AIR synthase-related protein [Bdellovibrionota bacterium]|jgi:hypothetical protein|nr:AIR synthase-related protein [Bdellovibrionota bacterium]